MYCYTSHSIFLSVEWAEGDSLVRVRGMAATLRSEWKTLSLQRPHRSECFAPLLPDGLDVCLTCYVSAHAACAFNFNYKVAVAWTNVGSVWTLQMGRMRHTHHALHFFSCVYLHPYNHRAIIMPNPV